MEEKRIALITGASRGIGKAIAKKLAERGMMVIINYCGNQEAANSVKKEIEEKGGEAEVFCCDVSDYDSCENMFRELINRFGRLDVLVNNAGITRDNLLMRMSEKEFNDVINTNLKGAFHTMHFVSRQMLKQKYGRIINLASVVGVSGNAGQVNYAASKAGVIGMTKSAAKELASKGITVNAVAPGFINTDMTAVLSDKVRKTAEEQIPAGVFGTPEQVASAVSYLAGEEAGYITGQVLHVDGGMVM